MLDALTSWLRPGPADSVPRWVVVDVEVSGLDAQSDRLLAIAALALRVDGERPLVVLRDSFEVVLQQDEALTRAPDKAGILRHGIGVGAQRAGLAPEAALASFARYAGDAPLVSFHPAFDRTMIERACDSARLPRPDNPWLDLGGLVSMLHPGVGARSLDAWLAHFGIRCLARHRAALDALAVAELLLRLWPTLRPGKRALPDARVLQALVAQRRWAG